MNWSCTNERDGKDSVKVSGIYLSYDTNTSRYDSSLCLSSAHSTQTGGDEDLQAELREHIKSM